MLEQLYQGITRMNGLARSFVWWPGMDLQLCGTKSEIMLQLPATHQNTSIAAPLHLLEWPKKTQESV